MEKQDLSLENQEAMLVRYSENVELETILPYGESNHPTSKHYTDQMMYVTEKKNHDS